MQKPVIGITMGDAAGIGPEITVKSLSKGFLYEKCRPVVLGDVKVIRQAIHLCKLDLETNAVGSADEGLYRHGIIDVVDYDDIDIGRLRYGAVSSMCGEAAVRYTREAGKMALSGEIQAMVSAPLNKESMRAAGYRYEGQTQILGELAGSKNYGMLLILDKLKLLLYTTHMSLKEACEAVTFDGVLKKIRLSYEGLKLFNLENPVIAVSALNPHAGEGGLFGREEADAIVPAIKEAQKSGINAAGPIPADTVFVRAMNGEFDLVIAMYHDQGNIAMKLLGFGHVVTLLAGLPIIRTSTGHGTAFDIAGRNEADAVNLIKAIELAAELGSNKLP